MNRTPDADGWDETARETLINALTEILKGRHGQPSMKVKRREAARQLVDNGNLLPNLRNIVQVYLEQNLRMWSVFSSTLAAHPELLAWATRRAALLQAREQHQAEGVPFWVMGTWAPSGCLLCGRPEHSLLQKATIGGHPFTPPRLGTGRWQTRVAANQHLLDQMRERRHDRATWFRERGYDRCRVCGVPSAKHPDQHTIWMGDPEDPWAAPDPAHTETGPYIPPTDDQVLEQVTRHRAGRWEHLYPETWYDAWNDVGHDEVLAGLSEEEHDEMCGKDPDDY